RPLPLRCGDFGPLVLDDRVEYHQAAAPWVNSTSSSSLRAARPESIASAATATPCARSEARPPTTIAAAALSSTTSRCGPRSPARIRRISPALYAASPPPMASRLAGARPTSLG